MNTRFRLDFRFLEQKSTRDCRGSSSRTDSGAPHRSNKRAGHRRRPFGFRNRKFAAVPVEQGGIYHFRCVKKAEMNLGDATQMEETEFARHEEQVVSGQSENGLENLDFSSNSGGLSK